MSVLKRGLWAAAAATVLAGGATAQTTTTTTGNTGGSTTVASTAGGIQQQQVAEAPTITAPSEGSSRSSAVATSNAFGNFYNNPLYQGRAGALGSGLTTVNAPGGFGTALYTSTGGSGAAGAGGVGGAAGSNANRSVTGSSTLGTGATGRTGGGLGATTGLGGAGGRTGGFGNTANQANQQLSTGRQIAYTQTLKFAAAPPMPPAQLAVDLQTMIAASSALTTGRGVQVTAADGGVVVLRGKVADDDERRLVEGMVLLTPGVKAVQNELTTK